MSAIDYSRKMMFPTNDNYAVRITEVEFTPSKRTGNPMIHFKTEVVSPDVVNIGGKEVNIAGVTTDQYFVVKTLNSNGEVDVDKTAGNRERLQKLWEDCGQDFSKFDENNPDLSWMKGALLLVAMGCDSEPQRKSPTPEQLANKQQGDIMKNPITGKDLVFFKPKIVEIFGVAPAGSVGVAAASNRPY